MFVIVELDEITIQLLQQSSEPTYGNLTQVFIILSIMWLIVGLGTSKLDLCLITFVLH